MDQIKSMLDRLSDLTDAEMAELQELIVSEFESIQKEDPTAQTVDAMTSLADALDSVRGESTRRTEEQAALTQRAAEAAARVKGEGSEAAAMPMDDEEKTEPVDTPVEEGEEPAEAPAPEEVPAEAVPAEDEEDPTKKKPAFSDESEAELSTEAPAEAEAAAEVPAEAEASTATPAEAEASTDAPTETALATEGTEESELSAEELAKCKPKKTASDDSSDESELSTTEDTTAELSADPTSPMEDAVTASGNEPQDEGVVVTPPADHLPIPTSAATITITAGADIPGYGAGSTLTDMMDVAKAFSKRLHTLRGVTAGGSGEQYTIATLNFDYPEERRLTSDDPSNWSKIQDVVSPQALTAAAGICAPLTTIYDVNTVGITDRPVRDALARFNADRGGVRLYGTPTLDADATGIWNTSGAATKTCGDAACADPTEVMVDAIYSCLKFSNFTNRFFPEMVKANTDLALIAHAKLAEINLLQGIQSGSIKVTRTSGGAGYAREVLVTVSMAAMNLRRRYRLADDQPLHAIIPTYVRDAMRADLALQMPGDGLEALTVADSQVEAFFRARKINVTWSIEAINANGTAHDAPTQGAGALALFEDTANFVLYPEGKFLFLDGGTLDLGVVRDGTMVAANEYSTFVETFEAVAPVAGAEALWITLSGLEVSGAAGELVTLSAYTGS